MGARPFGFGAFAGRGPSSRHCSQPIRGWLGTDPLREVCPAHLSISVCSQRSVSASVVRNRTCATAARAPRSRHAVALSVYAFAANIRPSYGCSLSTTEDTLVDTLEELLDVRCDMHCMTAFPGMIPVV